MEREVRKYLGKDRKHKDHYDVTNPKTGKRLKELIIMVTKYRQMDLKIKQKIMQQPYKKYEQDKTWGIFGSRRETFIMISKEGVSYSGEVRLKLYTFI